MEEIKNNPGVLPKILVCILRFGMWAEHIRPRIFSVPFKIIYHIFDFFFCKLLLNCDISAKASIGRGIRIYHPYGIFINADAVIGKNFTCRAQVTIGNKGTEGKKDGCPIIGDDVNVGIGAKIIGPIRVGDRCSIGANAVVTKSFDSDRILIGVPAHTL